MGTTADKLQYLIDSKNSISAAIQAKGGTVPHELSGYGPAIAALPSGSSDLALKIIDRSITELNASDFGSLTTIGGYAFRSCNHLSSVTFPSTITSIQTDAFYGCTALRSIEIPDTITSLGNSMFRGCTNLSSISLGTGFSTIPQYFLYGCTSLLSVEIPSTVTTVSNYAFYSSSNLETIDFGKTRSTVPTLGNTNAFLYLAADYKIYVPYDLYSSWCSASVWSNISAHIVANVPWEEGDTAVLNGSGDPIWYGSIVGTASSGSIPLSAQTSGTRLIVGSAVTDLGTGFLDQTNTFTEIDFSEATSLTAIGEYGLIVPNATAIVFPTSLASISANAFIGCTSCGIYDFSNFTSIPTLANSNAFASIAAANGKIKVPAELETAWQTAPNWSDLAQYIGWAFYDYYVDGTNGSDSNDGSQGAPFATIQKAINTASTGDSIGVRAGTYAPITSNNKDITIVGISGAENTIIDGGGTQRCAYLVSSKSATTGTDVLTKMECFTFQNGKITGRETDVIGNGGGVCGGTLNRCIIKNCTVSEYGSGGGFSCSDVYNSIVYGCTATPNCPVGINCNIVNCTLANNGQTGGTGLGIFGFGTIRNTLIAYNNKTRTIYYSGTTQSNIYTSTSSSIDSLIFVNPLSDWHLNGNNSTVTSSIKNKGSNTYAYGTKDYYGGDRIVDGTVDIGACEVQAS